MTFKAIFGSRACLAKARCLSFLRVLSVGITAARAFSGENVLGDYHIFPNKTNEFYVPFCTNATAGAQFLQLHLQVRGESFLGDVDCTSVRPILVDNKPSLPVGVTLMEEASGPEWCYVSFDLTAGFSDRLKTYRRAFLYVEPDLLVIHDHIVATAAHSFQFALSSGSNGQIDSQWSDLRVLGSNAVVRIACPAPKKEVRNWQEIESDDPKRKTFVLRPGAKLNELDLLTVIAVSPAGKAREYAFKLLESTSATGVRVHRDGLPTLIAFNTRDRSSASLTGFAFNGPVGVDVFRPKSRSVKAR